MLLCDCLCMCVCVRARVHVYVCVCVHLLLCCRCSCLDDEYESECPICAPENRKVLDIIRRQMEDRELHEQFQSLVRCHHYYVITCLNTLMVLPAIDHILFCSMLLDKLKVV